MNGMGWEPNPVLSADKALTEAERAALDVYVSNLERQMLPASDHEVASIFTQMLVSFPAQAVSMDAAKAKGRAYFIALEGLPKWAIQAACRNWLQGKAGPIKDPNFAYAPSAPQLRIIADDLMLPVRRHLYDLKRLLAAKVAEPRVSPERAKELASVAAAAFGGYSGHRRRHHASNPSGVNHAEKDGDWR